ncbi:MAG: hypothetical protein WCI45_07375 [Desulfuromonadales bacterium]
MRDYRQQVRPLAVSDTDDLKLFSTGFYAFQQKDYITAISYMDGLMQRCPDTVLRDMALFWLSQAYFSAGFQNEAARTLAQFFREYPALAYIKKDVDENLVELAIRYNIESANT